MKLQHSFWSLFAAMAMVTSCSQEEEMSNPSGGADGTVPNYLSIKISGMPNTRAEYEDGLAEESEVKKVRFYFFDSERKPAKVKYIGGALASGQTGYVNYMDWTPEDANFNGDDSDPSISHSSTANLIINTKKGDKLPSKVVAVINSAVAPIPNTDVYDIYETLYDATKHDNKNAGFYMVNSCFVSNNAIQFSVDITNNLAPTPEAAVNNPAVIYVERNVAKVVVYNQIHKINDTGQTLEKTEDGEKLYVDLKAWNVCDQPSHSFTGKHVSTSWSATMWSANEPWNNALNHRSYWAYNPPADQWTRENDSWNTHLQVNQKFDSGAHKYIEENAAISEAGGGQTKDDASKVFVCGIICDKDGNPISLAEVRGLRMKADKPGEGEYDKGNALLEYLLGTSFMKETKVNEGGTTRDLKPEDIVFKTKAQMGITDPSIKRYSTYIQFKDGLDVVHTSEGVTTSGLEKVNKLLVEEFGAIKYWKGGRSYYYIPIKHWGNQYGVVRNHLYNVNIQGVEGLGTPVSDPDEMVDPEDTEFDDTFIAAKINILAWHVIINNTVLGE